VRSISRPHASLKKLTSCFVVAPCWNCSLRALQEGTIGRALGRKEWHLTRKSGIVAGFRPYFNVRTGQATWMEPTQAHPNEYLPIVTHEPALADPDEMAEEDAEGYR